VLEPPLRRQFRGVNLVLKLGVVGPKSSTDGGTQHMTEGIIPGIAVYYTQISQILDINHQGFCDCTHRYAYRHLFTRQ